MYGSSRPPSAQELQELVELTRRDPGSPAFVDLGRAYLALGRPQEAVSVGERGLQMDPHNTNGRLMVSRAYVQLHQWKKAQVELLKVVKTDRNNAQGFTLLGEVLLRRSDYDRALPVLQHLADTRPRRGKPRIRVLVLTPTRELAAQIGESFATYGRHLKPKHLVIFGGVNENPQIAALRRGIDVLVATPGRLEDLMGQKIIRLHQVEILILDEADHMLDIGFIHALKRIVKTVPQKRQTLMFSATMPREIRELADEWLRHPAHVQVAPVSTPAEDVEQSVDNMPNHFLATR